MSWYYNQLSGNVFQATGAESTALNASIFAQKHDPIPGQTMWGPYATQGGALAAKAAHPSVSQQVSAVKSAIPSTTTIVTAVENWLVRFSEILVGVVLFAVAAHAIITNNKPTDSAASLTKTAIAAAKLIK